MDILFYDPTQVQKWVLGMKTAGYTASLMPERRGVSKILNASAAATTQLFSIELPVFVPQLQRQVGAGHIGPLPVNYLSSLSPCKTVGVPTLPSDSFN
uniref:hypothetical protein n=1 Tax=Pseudomonas sp. TaxID=306 RepID=UPI00159ED64D|nr:hypothetical protein [Pseudomonas sp.]